MARMPDFEADIRRDLAAVTAGIEHLIPHRRPSAGTPAAAQPAPATQEEYPMSRLTEAKNVIEDVAARVRELAANPLIDAIAEAGLGMVLTPAEIGVITGMISAFEQARKTTPQQADPQQPAAAQ